MRIIASAIFFGAIGCFFISTHAAEDATQPSSLNATSPFGSEQNTTNELNSTADATSNSTTANDTHPQPDAAADPELDNLVSQGSSDANDTEADPEQIRIARTQPLHDPPETDQLPVVHEEPDETPVVHEEPEEHPVVHEEQPEDAHVDGVSQEPNETVPEQHHEQLTEAPTAEDPEQAARDAEYAESLRIHNERLRQHEAEVYKQQQEEEEERQRQQQSAGQSPDQEHDRSDHPHGEEEHDPNQQAAAGNADGGLPPKQTIVATYKVATEQRCLKFLDRLKSKGRNEHSDHPLTCPAAYDGILCWRPADPGETLLQVCPDVPRQVMSYAKRECVNGQWTEYPHANSRMHLRDILHTSYEDCYRIPMFLRKHGAHEGTQQQQTWPAGHTSAEMRGPEVNIYQVPTGAGPAVTPSNEVVDSLGTTKLYLVLPSPTEAGSTDVAPDGFPSPPWFAASDDECQGFLAKHGRANSRAGSWCSGLSDGHYCWPETAPDTNVTQPCRLPSASEDAQSIPVVRRYCLRTGQWSQIRSDGSLDPAGFTNKEACNVVAGDLHVAGIGGHLLVIGESNTTGVPVVEGQPGASMALTSNEVARPDPRTPWLVSTQQGCEVFLNELARLNETQPGSCRGGTDGNICWPTIPKNTNFTQSCQNIPGFDASKTLTRVCGENGQWTDGAGNYSYYKECLSPELKELPVGLFKCPPPQVITVPVPSTSTAAERIVPLLPLFLSIFYFLL